MLRSPRLFLVDPEVAGDDYEVLGNAAGSPEEIRSAAARLQRLAHDGAFTPVAEPAVIVYRLAVGDHEQTGVVVEVPVEDYRNGRVRRHEATRDDRERELSEFQAAAGIELVPVTLAHPVRPALRGLLCDVVAAEPDLHMVSGDGLAQSVWLVRDTALATKIEAELAEVGPLYIADGHHRLAVAERHLGELPADRGETAADFVLGALFPADEMRVFGYHRGVPRPQGMTAAELLGALARRSAVTDLQECSGAPPQTEPGKVLVCLDGRWHRLSLRAPTGSVDARSALDVVVLEDGVLAPLLAGAEPDGAVTPLPGSFDPDAMERWCADHDAVGFLLHPPSVEQLMAVSDEGLLMPAKSTWFDPKARAGPFLRELRC